MIDWSKYPVRTKSKCLIRESETFLYWMNGKLQRDVLLRLLKFLWGLAHKIFEDSVHGCL